MLHPNLDRLGFHSRPHSDLDQATGGEAPLRNSRGRARPCARQHASPQARHSDGLCGGFAEDQSACQGRTGSDSQRRRTLGGARMADIAQRLRPTAHSSVVPRANAQNRIVPLWGDHRQRSFGVCASPVVGAPSGGFGHLPPVRAGGAGGGRHRWLGAGRAGDASQPRCSELR